MFNKDNSYAMTFDEAVANKLTVVKNLKGNTNKKIRQILKSIIKRMIDILGGIVGCILLLPITVCIFLANIIFHEKGSIFYTQERVGKDGKVFKIYKFRTMVENADEKLKKYLDENPEAKAEYKKYKKLKNDPRITKLGNILRKTSIDETPQFINVLKGEMSLVGPRPYLLREKEDMGEFYSYIIKIKPGITGLWQVHGRSDVSFEDRLSMDLNYYNHCNLKLDIKILAKTVSKIVKKEGAT